MKILFWLGGGFDRRTPSEHLLTAIIEALYKKGHTVHVVQKSTNGSLPELPEKLSTLGVTSISIPSQLPGKGNLVARYLSDVKYVCDCKRYIKKREKYDAVFMQSTNVAGFAIRMLRKKAPGAAITYNVQDIFPYNAAYSGSLSKSSIAFKVLAKIQRYAYRQADHIITISEDMKDLLVEDGVPSSKVEVVYNWSYQDEPYSESDLDCSKAREMFTSDKFNVVYAGNIGVMQNVDIIIEAAKLMVNEKSVHFHIIGEGAYKEKLQRKADNLGNVTFWPMLPSDSAPSIYMTADVNVIPLVKDIYKTALPSKTATCFACGKPIILCFGKESKFAQMVQEQTNCLCVDSDDAKVLCDAILKFKATPESRGYKEFFAGNLQKTKNSEKYAEIILK